MIDFKKDFFVVNGELNFMTTPLLWRESLPLLARAPQLNFDFTEVSASNSAGVAL
jgi:ABC-type transporter Mla MlaB component